MQASKAKYDRRGLVTHCSCEVVGMLSRFDVVAIHHMGAARTRWRRIWGSSGQEVFIQTPPFDLLICFRLSSLRNEEGFGSEFLPRNFS